MKTLLFCEGKNVYLGGEAAHLKPEKFVCLEDVVAALLRFEHNCDLEQFSNASSGQFVEAAMDFDVQSFRLTKLESLAVEEEKIARLGCSFHKGRPLLCCYTYAKVLLYGNSFHLCQVGERNDR